MATRDEIGEALKAADAAGDTEAATKLADAYANYQTPSKPTSLPLSLGSDPDSAMGALVAQGYQSDAAAVASAFPRYLKGAAGGAQKMALAAEDVAPPKTGRPVVSSPEQRATESAPLRASVAEYEKGKPALGLAGSFGEPLTEQILSAYPVGKAAGLISQGLGMAGRFAPILGNTIANAGYEGGKTAMQGGGITDVMKAAGLGAAGGAAGHVLGGAAQRGVEPVMSDAARTLLSKDVMPTYGAMIGRRASQAEEGLSYSPVIGGAIERARDRMASGYSKAELNEGLAPINKTVTEVGDKGAAQGKAFIKDAYTEATGHVEVPFFQKRYAINDAIQQIKSDVIGLSPNNAGKLNNVAEAIGRKGGNVLSKMDGETWKAMDSELNRLIRSNTGPLATAEERQFADGVRIFKDNLRSKVAGKAGAPPDIMDKLAAADAAYRNYVPIHKATSKAMGSSGEVGEFNPLQMYRSGEQTRVGTGDLTRSGLEVVSAPPPKTMGILRKALQLGGNAGALALDPTSAAVWAGANLAYSRPVQSLVAKGIPGVNAAFEHLPFTAAQLGSQIGGRALPRAMNRKRDQE